MMKKGLNQEGGYVFLAVLVVILLLSLLGGAYVLATNFELRQSQRHSDSKQAYYHARSGVEITVNALMKNADTFFNETNEPFYFKGDLDSLNEVSFGFGEFDNYSDEDFVSVVEWDGEKGTIRSTGYYNREQYIVRRSFQVADGDIDIRIPLSSSADARSADDGLEWINVNNGRLNIPNNTEDSTHDGPVLFSNKDGEDSNYIVITEGDAGGHSSRSLTAPIMYFTDEPDSLHMDNQNAILNLETDVLVFNGNVLLGPHNQRFRGSINLSTHNSTLTGADIQEAGNPHSPIDPGARYGLLYIGGDFVCYKTGDLLFSQSGYFYFPHGIELGNDGKLDAYTHLVPVDEGDINLGKLGIMGYYSGFSLGDFQ